MLTFPKTLRLLHSRDFRLCGRQGRVLSGKFLHLQVRRSVDTKFGLTVSKKYGKAHHRNRFKRLMREVFRLSQHELPAPLHINARPHPAALKASFHELRQELADLIADVHQ